MNAVFTRRTERRFPETLEAVQEAGKRYGFRISHVHDLAAAMRSGGFEREPYAVVELCRADIAYGVLTAEPGFGAFMPCRIAVYPEGDGTVLTTVLPSNLLVFFPARPEVDEAATRVDGMLKAIIEEASA